MATQHNTPAYYIPHSGWYPVWLAFAMFLMLAGLGSWLNSVKAGDDAQVVMFTGGLLLLFVVLFFWYLKVIRENLQGLAGPQLKRSYVWGMWWFIFSEVMFFFAFFGALFYARVLAVSWLGGEGAKGITGEYLWPEFSPEWPVMENPDDGLFTGPNESMQAPRLTQWASYLPFWNTAILLTSSVTIHFAHTAIKNENRAKLKMWLGVTILLGVVFLILQAEEYIHAYSELGLTLGSGIYGSTFYLLTGFHGFHVTLGTIILIVQWFRSFKGHFTHEDCFGFEAASWYWHFVDVVWVCLFVFVYVL